ncbi:LOW QUALITY PROTEIN: hypothetical protein MXB_1933 [Myxobolus squamalis]|nr:LOW QUALITY PROTEIN: hypothetical protein MXB_1933 [Myxobolus squamalis]
MIDAAPGHKNYETKLKFRNTGTTLAMILGVLTKFSTSASTNNLKFICKIVGEMDGRWLQRIDKSVGDFPNSAIKTASRKLQLIFAPEGSMIKAIRSKEDNESPKDAEARLQLLDVFLDKENFSSEDQEYK